MKLPRLSALLLAALLATPAAMAQRIHDVIVTADGSEYAGYISHQDQQKGLITVKADYLIRSLSPANCRVGEDRTVTFAQLSPEAKDWYRRQSPDAAELTPETPVSLRDVQETVGDRTLWRDAFILEEGRVIKFIVFGRTFQLEADAVQTIRHAERPADATEGIVDVFITSGLSVPQVEGQLIEESVGEFYRVLIKGTNGQRDRIVNISAENVLSRSKRPLNPEVSLYRQAALVDEVRTAGGESIRGVIATMDMGREEIVVVTEDGVSRIVKAADVASITTAPAAAFPASVAPVSIPSAQDHSLDVALAETLVPTPAPSSESSAAAGAPAEPVEVNIPALDLPEVPEVKVPAKVNISAKTEEPAKAEVEESVEPVKAEPAAEESEAPEAETAAEAPEAEAEPAAEEHETEPAAESEEDPEEQFFEQDPDDEDADEEAEEAEETDEAEEELAEAEPEGPSGPQTIPVPASAAKAKFYVSKKPLTPVEATALPNGYWSLQGDCTPIDHKGSDAYIEVPVGVPSNDAIEVYPLASVTSDGTAYPYAFSTAESTKVVRVKKATSERPVPGHKRLTFQLTSPGRYVIYRPADKMVMWFEWK